MRPGHISQAIMIVTLTLLMATAFSAQGQESDDALAGQAGWEYWKKIDKEAVETGSGLQYKILYTGKGRKARSNGKIEVHYRGLLLNGVQVDSSYDSDEPVELNMKQVIEGWSEGLQLMSEGAVYVFLIPPELAYGAEGNDSVPPNSTLIFTIELFKAK